MDIVGQSDVKDLDGEIQDETYHDRDARREGRSTLPVETDADHWDERGAEGSPPERPEKCHEPRVRVIRIEREERREERERDGDEPCPKQLMRKRASRERERNVVY